MNDDLIMQPTNDFDPELSPDKLKLIEDLG
jgi:hypothetical protein